MFINYISIFILTDTQHIKNTGLVIASSISLFIDVYFFLNGAIDVIVGQLMSLQS